MTRAAAIMMIAALIAGCGNMPSRPADEQEATAQAGYGRAFGRIVFLEDGKEKEWGTSILAPEMLTLFVRALPGGEMQYMQIDGKGDFSWPLKPGGYVIVAYQVTHRMVTNQRYTARLWTAFSVPAAGQAVYIGDLRIEANKGAYRFGVIDQYAEALSAQGASFKQAKFEPVKGLMRPEAPFGTFNRVIGICNEAWRIKCDKQLQGVEPVLPDGTAQGFPVTENLAPVLEWKPSTRPGATYDVVIFESLSFAFGAVGSVSRMRGAQVAYGERLQEPRFTPAAPLEPGKKYEWTVRIRDGDTVSTWSSTSYFVFALVAAASGSGQGFGFTTPAK